MGNSSLTPTSIVDKNGKHTTVHKRAVDAKSGRKSVPAPALVVASEESKDHALKRTKAACDAADFPSSGERLVVDSLLAEMPVEALRHVADLLDEVSPCYELVNSIASVGDAVSPEVFEDFTAKMADHYPRLYRRFEQRQDNTYSVEAFNMIRGLQHHAASYPNTTRQQFDALADAITAINSATAFESDYHDAIMVSRDDGGMKTFINSDELTEYIIENPEEVERLSDLMHEMPSLSTVELLHLLKNRDTSKALVDGAL